MQAIEQGVNHFAEGSAVLMNALDEVSKLHPFIGGDLEQFLLSAIHANLALMHLVAVNAFKVEPSDTYAHRIKAVYTSEIKRRETDKKIMALHVEMKQMMTVLVQYVDTLLLLPTIFILPTG
jgi:hypothetical protein